MSRRIWVTLVAALIVMALVATSTSALAIVPAPGARKQRLRQEVQKLRQGALRPRLAGLRPRLRRAEAKATD